MSTSVGFDSASAFARAFLSRTEETPSAYRNRVCSKGQPGDQGNSANGANASPIVRSRPENPRTGRIVRPQPKTPRSAGVVTDRGRPRCEPAQCGPPDHQRPNRSLNCPWQRTVTPLTVAE